MRSSQRVAGSCIVVERTGLPSSLRMTSLAVRTETSSRMHRIGSRIVIFQMTGNAGRRSSHKSL